MNKREYKLIPFFFLSLFVLYMVSITAFTHQHVVNGVKVAHSHPYSNKSHTHTTGQLITIAQLSVIQTNEAEPAIAFTVDYPMLYELEIQINTFHKLLLYKCCNSLRAPPYYC